MAKFNQKISALVWSAHGSLGKYDKLHARTSLPQQVHRSIVCAICFGKPPLHLSGDVQNLSTENKTASTGAFADSRSSAWEELTCSIRSKDTAWEKTQGLLSFTGHCNLQFCKTGRSCRTMSQGETCKALARVRCGVGTSPIGDCAWPCDLSGQRFGCCQDSAPPWVLETHCDIACIITPARDTVGLCFSRFSAGGARDAHWTGTNEDASVASVKSIRGAGLTYLLGEKPT